MKRARRPGRPDRRHPDRRHPDRRLAPRPLPAHLLSAIGFWLSSRAALPALRNGWRPTSGVGERLGALAAELAALAPEAAAAALDRALTRRAALYLAGLEA
ncbi:MAG TPA: hypothetical protein VE993_02510, partial [Stellaceae bacterium]|nr:hypothetical protein [Stellaceae bacterium]